MSKLDCYLGQSTIFINSRIKKVLSLDHWEFSLNVPACKQLATLLCICSSSRSTIFGNSPQKKKYCLKATHAKTVEERNNVPNKDKCCQFCSVVVNPAFHLRLWNFGILTYISDKI